MSSREDNLKEYRKFAAETLIDIAKLLITLSSGFLAFTATLLSNFQGSSSAGSNVSNFGLLATSWTVIVVSIISGVLGIGSIATTAQENGIYNIDINNTNKYLAVQQVFFVLSFILFALFAARNIL